MAGPDLCRNHGDARQQPSVLAGAAGVPAARRRELQRPARPHGAQYRAPDRQVSRSRHRGDGAWRHDPRGAGARLQHASGGGGALRDRQCVDHPDRAFRAGRSGPCLEGRLHQLPAAPDRGRAWRQQGVKSKEQLAAEQAAYWNGPGGKMWLGAYDRIQRGIADFSDVVLSAANAQPGERVLDVGCGTGGTTASLAKAVGLGGHVLGVDISEPLIAAAWAQKLANAAFEVGDAATYPFAPGAFDLVFSRFGVMFFADPVAAFKNIRRAMKPSGRLVFLC